MTERARFVALRAEALYSMTELCQRFQISRKTGYKWLERYLEAGVEALADRSRAPHRSPLRTDPTVEAALVLARQKRPTWGPKKLVAHLRRGNPEVDWPAPSTAGAILKRHGLVSPARRRRKLPHPGSPPLVTEAPNQVWAADFKGEFPTRDGRLCYPLTVTDAHTRYLLACQALPSTEHAGAQQVFTRLFNEYGLPEAIRSDNGTPFATQALGGLSRLNVWWLKLGIQHQRIRPAHPQENGRHERMHRTLKAETARPPAANHHLQQERFTEFRQEFNHERPHEALGMETPGTLYAASPRVLPVRLPKPEYAGHQLVRLVDKNGCIKVHSRALFVSGVLAGEYVALEEVDEGIWSVFFYTELLARFHERDWQLRT